MFRGLQVARGLARHPRGAVLDIPGARVATSSSARLAPEPFGCVRSVRHQRISRVLVGAIQHYNGFHPMVNHLRMKADGMYVSLVPSIYQCHLLFQKQVYLHGKDKPLGT